MSNRVRLEDLPGMKPAEIAALPVDQLAELQADLAEARSRTKEQAACLIAGLDIRYGAQAADKRKAAGKDAGTVAVSDGEFRCKVDLKHKIGWDQKALADAVATIRDEWKGNPADYVKTTYEVSEAKFKAWPPEIRKIFEPARTVTPGNATYELEPSK